MDVVSRPRRKMLGNRRVTGMEQCYTPPHVAEAVIDAVTALVPDWRDRPWLEPCGGTGTFVDVLRSRGVEDVTAVDLEPRHPDVREADFLVDALPPISGAITATNPPFGRNNAMSVPFFNRAAEVSDVIAFIVPRSWRKWSVVNRLHPEFHCILDDDLQIDYLDADGEKLYERNNLRTAIQVWRRGTELRTRIDAEDRGYIRKVTPTEADVSLTIFGRGCGTVRTEFARVPNTTQMFLEVRDRQVLEALRSVDFSRFYNNVAYTEALSIKEIFHLLNEHFDERATASSTGGSARRGSRPSPCRASLRVSP